MQIYSCLKFAYVLKWSQIGGISLYLVINVSRVDLIKPRQANLCLRAFRHDKF